MTKDIFLSIANSVLRKVLAAAGGYFVTEGWVEAGTWEQVVGGLVLFLGAVAWGAYVHYVKPKLDKLPRE